MSNATSIKGLFQGLVPDPGGVIQGTVKSVYPLSVQPENDSKLTLNANLLILPHHLTKQTATAYISYSEYSGNVSLTIDNSLCVGDKVYLLSFNGGRRYYILDKAV